MRRNDVIPPFLENGSIGGKFAKIYAFTHRGEGDVTAYFKFNPRNPALSETLEHGNGVENYTNLS